MSPAPMPHRDQAFRDQPSLFDAPPAPVTAPVDRVPTDQGKQSRDETYREVRETHDLQRQKWLVRIMAAGRRGVTLDELSARFNVPANSFSGRITELKDLGSVVRTGERRPTRAGKSAAVIVAADFFRGHPAPGNDDRFDNGGEPTGSGCGGEIPGALEEDAVSKCDVMPDQLTNSGTVRDSQGRPLEPGRRYSISQRGGGAVCRVQVYEDEQSNLCCCRVAGEQGQRIDEMDPSVVWVRL